MLTFDYFLAPFVNGKITTQMKAKKSFSIVVSNHTLSYGLNLYQCELPEQFWKSLIGDNLRIDHTSFKTFSDPSYLIVFGASLERNKPTEIFFFEVEYLKREEDDDYTKKKYSKVFKSERALAMIEKLKTINKELYVEVHMTVTETIDGMNEQIECEDIDND